MGDASATALKCDSRTGGVICDLKNEGVRTSAKSAPERRRALRRGNRRAGRFASGAGNHELAGRHRVAHRAEHPVGFGLVEQRRLAVRAESNDTAEAGTHPALDVEANRRSVDVAVGKRRHHRRKNRRERHRSDRVPRGRLDPNRPETKKPEAGSIPPPAVVLRRESPGLMDPGTPHRLRPAPVLVEDRPQRLVEVFAVAEERLAQDALLLRAHLAERAVAATVRDRSPRLEPVRADRRRTRSRRPSSRRP